MLRDPDGRAFALAPLWHATAIGFMVNNLLPARAGEVARAYVAKRQLAVRFTTAIASVAVERVFDGLVLVGLMALVLAWPASPGLGVISGSPIGAIAAGVAILFALILLAALAAAYRPGTASRLMSRPIHALLPTRLADRAEHMVEGALAGLAVLRHGPRLVGVVAWSFVLWGVSAASFALAFRAFGLVLPFQAALLLQGVVALGVALPASPGFWGPFEAATRLTLTLYGVGAEQAVSYAVTYHLTTFLPITLLGLYSQSRVHVRLAELRAADGERG
jgi:uncharacterized protein (TIRG00374 family)